MPLALHLWLKITGSAFAVAALLMIYLRRRGMIATIWLWLLNMVLAVVFCCCLVHAATTINQKSNKQLAMTVKAKLLPTDEVVNFYQYFQDVPVYLERQVSIVADWHNPNIALSDNWLRELWYGKDFQDTSTWLIDETTFWQQWHSTKHLYVFLRNKDLARFTAAAGKYYLLQKNNQNDVLLLSNHLF